MRLQVVLASQSPRRREILTAAGIPFTVRVPNVPEVRGAGETPADYVRRLALEKASAVPLHPGEVILGADTVVVAMRHVLEKPLNADDAERMLCILSDREHSVLTGICLRTETETVVDLAETRVRFGSMTREDIAAYVASGEPQDKAGAYAIQGRASKYIEAYRGVLFQRGWPAGLAGLPRLKEIGYEG